MNPLIEKNLSYIIFPAIACFLSLILTRISVSVMPLLGFVAEPGGRHIHKNITPKAGGVAIITAFVLTWLLFLYSPWNYFIGEMSMTFLGKISIPAGMLILLGIIDDKYAIRARYKLVGQILVGMVCCYMGIRFGNIFSIQLTTFWSCALTIFWIVGFVNAFNLIDGLDGLAAGLGIVSSLCMSAIFIFEHAPLNTVVILCLAGSCLGFLKYNFYPARIFMGDTGSMFLGFMIAVIGMESSVKIATFSSVLVPLLAAGIPIFDVFLAIWRRLSRRLLNIQSSSSDASQTSSNRVMTADKEHLHHRLLDRNGNQTKTTLILYLLALVLGIIAVSLVFFKHHIQGLAFIIILGTFATAIRYLATVELWNSTKAIIHGIHNPKKGLLVAMSHPFFDLFVIFSSYVLSFYLFNSFLYSTKFITNLFHLSFYNILPIVIVLHIGRIYKRNWMRASAIAYIKLGELLLIGHIINFTIQYFIHKNDMKDFKIFVAQYLIFLLLSSAFIFAERMSLRYVRSVFLKNLYLKNHISDSIPKAIVYGGGLRCRYYLTEKFNMIEEDPIDILGIIDDQIAIRGQYVYDFKVLGNINDLENIYKKNPFDRLIISAIKIDDYKKNIAKKFCIQNNIKLTELIFQENVISNS
jgi:UDP-GlcNAc:undecaprenyl-phosphate/decaprenyl-phosphate GlcNAc-1-phosphate transferase